MDFWSFFWLLVWSFFFVAYLMMLFQIFGDLFRDESLGGVRQGVVGRRPHLLPADLRPRLRHRPWQGMAERTMKRNSEAMAAQEDYIRSVAAPHRRRPSRQLTQAKALLDAGAITPEEFAEIKAEALA